MYHKAYLDAKNKYIELKMEQQGGFWKSKEEIKKQYQKDVDTKANEDAGYITTYQGVFGINTHYEHDGINSLLRNKNNKIINIGIKDIHFHSYELKSIINSRDLADLDDDFSVFLSSEEKNTVKNNNSMTDELNKILEKCKNRDLPYKTFLGEMARKLSNAKGNLTDDSKKIAWLKHFHLFHNATEKLGIFNPPSITDEELKKDIISTDRYKKQVERIKKKREFLLGEGQEIITSLDKVKFSVTILNLLTEQKKFDKLFGTS